MNGPPLLAHTGVDHLGLALLGVALVVVYGLAWSRAGESTGRLAAWIGGVGALLVASLPVMEDAAESSFTGHMVQHLIMIIVAAPLLVAARPFVTVGRGYGLATTAAGRSTGRWWRRWSPVLAPIVFVGVLVVTHLTDVYDAALGDRLVHEVTHVGYLTGALMVWSAVLAPRPRSGPARIGVALGVIAGGALLGLVLLSAPEPLVDTYARQAGPVEALADQRRAASLMWVAEMATTLPLLIVAAWRWATAEEQAARRAEALADAGGDIRRPMSEGANRRAGLRG